MRCRCPIKNKSTTTKLQTSQQNKYKHVESWTTTQVYKLVHSMLNSNNKKTHKDKNLLNTKRSTIHAYKYTNTHTNVRDIYARLSFGYAETYMFECIYKYLQKYFVANSEHGLGFLHIHTQRERYTKKSTQKYQPKHVLISLFFSNKPANEWHHFMNGNGNDNEKKRTHTPIFTTNL